MVYGSLHGKLGLIQFVSMDVCEIESVKDQTEGNVVDFNTAYRVKNKALRRAQVVKDKRRKNKLKKEERKKRRDSGAPKNVPKTIDSMREKDDTVLVDMDEESQLELNLELDRDEMNSYFQKTYVPRVLITFSDNPHEKCRIFVRELTRVIPNSVSLYRNRSGVKKMVKSAIDEGFTDIIIINEDKRQPNGMLLIHLPDGPTAHFRLSNVKLTPDLKRSYKEISEHRPEVILNNFSTHLGNTVSRMLAALFHYEPEFKGRRAVTFHNQRDYIFFRHHRYEFTSSGKVRLRELGPRFTLKLRSLQDGTFDSKTGDYRWIITDKRHDMETSRRKFYL